VNVIAPGKLVLTGAYAVLEGAPAIVVAVDRYAVADPGAPDRIDVRALKDEKGRKLGLGSSAASRVASEGACAMARGEDLRDPLVRAGLFRRVRAAHADEQRGGSGVDVAAAVHGGALRYVTAGNESVLRAVDLPAGLILRAFWSGTSARTSELRARVDALLARDPLALAPLRPSTAAMRAPSSAPPARTAAPWTRLAARQTPRSSRRHSPSWRRSRRRTARRSCPRAPAVGTSAYGSTSPRPPRFLSRAPRRSE